MELKLCQNCKNKFAIEPEDLEFYSKINVSPPTFCPDCRLQRRLAWRNERTFYKRKCDVPGHNHEITSIYHKDSPFKVYCKKYWESDEWDPMQYGQDYDWNKSFFEQYRELILKVPRIALFNDNSIDSDYCNYVKEHRSCYLESAGFRSEFVLYSYTTIMCKYSSDLFMVSDSENCYELIDSYKCYNVLFSRYCENCSDSAFLFDCKSVSNCFGCIGLRHKQYCIFNEQYTKEEYFEKLQEFNLGSYSEISFNKEKIKEFYLKYPFIFAKLIKSQDVSGQNISNSKNCHYCFDIRSDSAYDFGVANGKYLFVSGWNTKDSYDLTQHGLNVELCYELISANGNYSTKFSTRPIECTDVQYSDNCSSSSSLFGCVGLTHKQYCILNKQYTKSEYESLVPKIIEHMNQMPYIDKKRRTYKYGEFFPIELSPFSYNETIAQEYSPLAKEAAEQQGYFWKEREERNYQITIKAEDLPDQIKDIKDDILKEIIGCLHQAKCNENCTQAYKIIPQELEFYRKMNVPLSRLCPNCRHYQKVKQRDPLKLWHRKCQCDGEQSENSVYKNRVSHSHHSEKHCPNEFETVYEPKRKEIIYCEQCYLEEMY